MAESDCNGPAKPENIVQNGRSNDAGMPVPMSMASSGTRVIQASTAARRQITIAP